MFLYGTDNKTLRAWPVETIKSMMYSPRGKGEHPERIELAVYLQDSTGVWFHGREASGIWAKIVKNGIGVVRSGKK